MFYSGVQLPNVCCAPASWRKSSSTSSGSDSASPLSLLRCESLSVCFRSGMVHLKIKKLRVLCIWFSLQAAIKSLARGGSVCASGSSTLQLPAFILGSPLLSESNPFLGFFSLPSLFGIVLDTRFLNKENTPSNFQLKFIHGQTVHNHLLFCQHILLI